MQTRMNTVKEEFVWSGQYDIAKKEKQFSMPFDAPKPTPLLSGFITPSSQSIQI